MKATQTFFLLAAVMLAACAKRRAGIAEKVKFEFEQTFMFYLPRICEHCLNPSCAASCPSGAIYKRSEDGHLAVVLEFAAASEPHSALRLLCRHRAGIELLRLALRDENPPWADVIESISATLPELGGDELSAVAKLVAQGPPEEQVGLAPFAPPEYMPEPAGDRR